MHTLCTYSVLSRPWSVSSHLCHAEWPVCVFLSLLVVSCCTSVSDLVMHAAHVFDPHCSPLLCTLHNHSQLNPEMNLHPRTHTHTHVFFPISFLQIPTLKDFVIASLCVFFFYSSSTPFPYSFFFFFTTIFYSTLCSHLLLPMLPVVSLGVKEACLTGIFQSVCVCVLLDLILVDWACLLHQWGTGLHYYHKAVTGSVK